MIEHSPTPWKAHEELDGATKHMPADVAEETRRLAAKNSTLTSNELSSN